MRKKDISQHYLSEKIKYVENNPGCTVKEVNQYLKKMFKDRFDTDEFLEQNHKLDMANHRFMIKDNKLYSTRKGIEIKNSIKRYKKKLFFTLISRNVKDGLHVLATIITIITGIMIMFKIQ